MGNKACIVVVRLNLVVVLFIVVDLSSWEKKLSEQEKGEDEGVLYDEYPSSEESDGKLTLSVYP